MKAKLMCITFLTLFASVFLLTVPGNRVYASTGDTTVYLPMIQNGNSVAIPGELTGCLTTEEAKLATLINSYRRSNNLPDVPISRSLTSVAQWHVIDLVKNNPVTGACNMHSWSNKGLWSPVCYTADHQYASGMWIKPNEISKGIYTGYGYEIAYWTSSGTVIAADALNAWKNSSGHNNVILEKDIWAGKNWPAMGVGIYQGYAVTWFSTQIDPAGTIQPCN